MNLNLVSRDMEMALERAIDTGEREDLGTPFSLFITVYCQGASSTSNVGISCATTVPGTSQGNGRWGPSAMVLQSVQSAPSSTDTVQCTEHNLRLDEQKGAGDVD